MSNLQFPLPKLALNNPAAIAQMLRPNAAGAAVPPAGPQAVDLQSLVQRAMNNELRINMSQNTQVNTDAQGRFAFDHVIPGRISVMRRL